MSSRGGPPLSLLDLPVELYLEITGHLSSADVFHLAQASKLNRHLLLKELYAREIGARSDRALRHGLAKRIPSTLAFIRESGVQSFDLILSDPSSLFEREYPLIRAAAARDTSFVDTLLMYGSDPNLVSPRLQTPLSTTLRASVESSGRRCPMSMVTLLLKRGARADTATPRTKYPGGEHIKEALDLARSPPDWRALKTNPAAPRSPYANIPALLATALREWPSDDKESPVQLVMKLGACATHGDNSCLVDMARAFFDVGHESLTPTDAEALAEWMAELGAPDDGEICLFLYEDRRRDAKRRRRPPLQDEPRKQQRRDFDDVSETLESLEV
ncbi:hypothetical protein B0T22DRAFT_481133 [Podospora appendiculata]|uniref:F-box domain-containing protein n=1 Tax=Podospora appendiculata TaxID=314037 RepID=A0AAE0XC91_9PEZI|nr:hypothetical protein B0T22DRAFT_481133 [Podospora appendiculata]